MKSNGPPSVPPPNPTGGGNTPPDPDDPMEKFKKVLREAVAQELAATNKKLTDMEAKADELKKELETVKKATGAMPTTDWLKGPYADSVAKNIYNTAAAAEKAHKAKLRNAAAAAQLLGQAKTQGFSGAILLVLMVMVPCLVIWAGLELGHLAWYIGSIVGGLTLWWLGRCYDYNKTTRQNLEIDIIHQVMPGGDHGHH